MGTILQCFFTNKHEIIDFTIGYSVIVDKKGVGNCLTILENSQYTVIIDRTKYKLHNSGFPQYQSSINANLHCLFFPQKYYSIIVFEIEWSVIKFK